MAYQSGSFFRKGNDEQLLDNFCSISRKEETRFKNQNQKLTFNPFYHFFSKPKINKRITDKSIKGKNIEVAKKPIIIINQK
ncbi:hypothetical protein [Staphylococcus simulans]|uniref:hypothetical protein n=1 Tax=Staphylococcus simulans TaxID=1286 RepID=UPI0015FE0235|nr:hypothetical protein [Staphylococcus simulans]